MSLILKPQTSQEEARQRAQEALFRAFDLALDRPILFLSSGGSAFDLLDQYPDKLLASQLTLSVLDERWTDDSAGSNFSVLMETAFARELLKNGGKTIDPRPLPEEKLEATARRFETALRDWRAAQEDWTIIATLGIGADGHTAGIFPMPNDATRFTNFFDDPNRWVVGYDVGTDTNYPIRITTTLAFLHNAVDEVIIYAVGTEKKNILTKIKNAKESVAACPAIALTQLRQAKLFTDLALDDSSKRI